MSARRIRAAACQTSNFLARVRSLIPACQPSGPIETLGRFVRPQVCPTSMAALDTVVQVTLNVAPPATPMAAQHIISFSGPPTWPNPPPPTPATGRTAGRGEPPASGEFLAPAQAVALLQ
jgi:hypothetical protein